MSLIEKLKNRETKKKLREENIRLQEENKCLRNVPVPNICTIERNIQKICSDVEVNQMNIDMPEEYIKRNIARNMIDHISPFIEYDFRDNGYGGKIYTGILYVATGDRKYEH